MPDDEPQPRCLARFPGRGSGGHDFTIGGVACLAGSAKAPMAVPMPSQLGYVHFP